MAELERSEVLHRNPVTQQGFTMIPNAVLTASRLSSGARLLYGLLKMHAWQADNAFPGQERLAGYLGVSTRQVRTYQTELEDAGLITIEQRGLRQTNRYWIEDIPAAFLSDRNSTSDQDRKPASDQDRNSTSDKEDSAVKKTQQKKREIAPAPVPGDIPREQRSEPSRDMASIKPIPATPLPDIYPLTEDMQAWARANVPSLNGSLATEHSKFCAYYRSIAHDKKLGRRSNWRPVWELWMTRQANGEFAVGRATQPAPKAPQYFAKRG